MQQQAYAVISEPHAWHGDDDSDVRWRVAICCFHYFTPYSGIMRALINQPGAPLAYMALNTVARARPSWYARANGLASPWKDS